MSGSQVSLGTVNRLLVLDIWIQMSSAVSFITEARDLTTHDPQPHIMSWVVDVVQRFLATGVKLTARREDAS